MWLKYVVAFIAFVLMISGCGKKEPEVIKIGVVGPFSGQLASWGGYLRKGIELAYNGLSKDEKEKIVLLYEDSEADPKKAVSAVQKLISSDNVKIIIGPVTSSEVLSVAPIAEKLKTILLAPMAPHKDITQAGDYIFRIYPSDEKRSIMLADYTVHELKAKQIGIIYCSDEFGTSTFKIYSRRLIELGIDDYSIITESYQTGITDFKTVITKVKSKRPDITFIVGHSKDLGYIVKQSYEQHFKTQFVSTADFEHPDVLKIAGDAADGTIYGYMVFDVGTPDSALQDFRKGYQKYYTTSEEPGLPVALSYDAFGIIHTVIGQARTADEIREGLYHLKDYPGATGKITFDENGDVTRSWGLKVVKNRQFITLKTNYP